MSKFTKGIWEMSCDMPYVISCGERHIATIGSFSTVSSINEENLANALLISKAPRILELIEKLFPETKLIEIDDLIDVYEDVEDDAYELLSEIQKIQHLPSKTDDSFLFQKTDEDWEYEMNEWMLPNELDRD